MNVLKTLGRLTAGLQLHMQRLAINDGRSFNVGGFHRWKVGDATVTKVVELEGEGFGDFLLPDAKRETLNTTSIALSHLGPRGGIKLSVHSFIVEISGKRVLVDTNVGNGKRRKVPIWNKLQTPWLTDLERAGFAPNTIDMVVCTHLHIDHVGWNTTFVDGRWVPTFPRARYLFVRGEYDYWAARQADPARAELFADSIDPVVRAGLVDLIDADAEIAAGLRVTSTPGHTDHHASVLIDSNGVRALITGDFLHHPVQVLHPDWSSSFDTSPATSVSTRLAWFAKLADERILIFGTAFPDPSAGYIVRDGRGFAFEPVESS